ncbi:DgyrCDS10351 [Dimorphilus gyrociliatus]|uniref:Glycosyltransferase family 92 protein n=1 Tax=Dimorphilus gyrociliatus TaxID=2664684 RepID=A0A7I8VZX1_9ANNE|nr:DgyrCDS10351 [Dimorphilus gyrociliatus]
MYAFSAFYDDRSTLQGSKCIRIVAIAEKKLVEKSAPYCHIVYEKGLPDIVQSRPADIGVGVSYRGYWFREYVFECPLQSNRLPLKIFLANKSNQRTQWSIPVEFPQTPKIKQDFAVCVICAFSKFNPSRVLEFVEMHRLLGVSQIYVYNNNLEPTTHKLFKQLHEMGKIDLTDFKTGFFETPAPSHAYYAQASPAVNDCILRNMYSYKKLIIVDLDEIIIPNQGLNYKDMLEAIDKKYPRSIETKSYHFRNAYFFSDFDNLKNKSDTNNDSKEIATFRRYRAKVSGPGYSIKSIIDPLSCYGMHNHFCWHKTKAADVPNESLDVPVEFGTLHHYKKCHFDKAKCAEIIKNPIVDESALKFRQQLLLNMNSTAQYLKLKDVF